MSNGPVQKIIKQKSNKQQQQVSLIQQIVDQDCQWNPDENFEVQRIIGEETWNNIRYYLIKWKGYDITLSTWEQAEGFDDMKDLIEEFNKTQKGKNDKSIMEKTGIKMNPYRATEIHGHFLYGDQPNSIVNTFVQFNSEGKKTIFLEISWKQREIAGGMQILQNSILDSDIVFQHNPQFLIDFYKSSIKIQEASESNKMSNE